MRVSQVIAAVAKVSCKHGLWLVARVNKNPGDIISGAYDVRDRIRTHDLLVRSQTLYPAELHVHFIYRFSPATVCIVTAAGENVNRIFQFFQTMKSQAINAKLYLRNIISSFCTTMFAFCWQICTDCPSFRFALCLFYSFYASLASSFWNSSPEVFHPNISLG